MFDRILAPLDGSSMAETVLPAIAHFMRVCNSKVTLLHLVETNAPQQVHGDRHLSSSSDAQSYLSRVTARLPHTAHVEQHVHTSEVDDVARSIVAHANELKADLIIMCTHGSSGLRSWLFGSIAQQVVALGDTPVLLIHPDAPAADFRCQRVLVPLDGDLEHEGGLTVAIDLVQRCAAELLLLVVVPTVSSLTGARSAPARLLPGATSALLDISQQQAQDYLDQLILRRNLAAPSAQAEVQRGDPTDVIIRTAQSRDADLVVLATHGRTQMGAFWAGSVAPRVSSRAMKPLLLVPVREPGHFEEIAVAQTTAQLIAAFNDAFNRHDVDGMMALMTEDCVFENTYPPPDGARFSGAAAVRGFWQQFFRDSPRATIHSEEFFSAGDRAVQTWVYHWGEPGATGHVRGVDLFHLRNGKIAAKLSYVKG